MSVSATGRLYGTPGEDDPALNIPLTVTVTDMYDLSDTLSTTFDVIDINSPPHILTVTLRDARETRAYADTVLFRDADTGDTHAFSLLRSPSWMTVNSEGILGGTPGLFDSGVNIPVHVAVTDAGGLSDTLRVTINVADVTNQYASFSIDTDLEHTGCQEDSVLYNPGPGNELGFAVYLREVDEVRSFRLRITWNPSVVSLVHSRSGSSITGGDYDINGEENVLVAGEKNALVAAGGFLSSLIEENDPGVFTVVTAKMGGEAFRGPDGLLYFIVFRTRDEVPVTESFTINLELDIIDDKGIINTLDPREFVVGEFQGLFPPSRLVVQDVMNDHGHLMQLTWVPSPHEISGRVKLYRIYRSRTPVMGEVRPLSSFMTVDELVAWEGHSVVLVDSVSAGFHGYIDKFVPLLSVPYYYWLQAVGTGIASSKISSEVSTAVTEAPAEFDVGHPWPNPFNPSTSLEFTLPREMRVRLRVVNLAGQTVTVLGDSIFGPGRHTAQWDAAGVPSGMYFLVVDAGSRRISRKVLLLK
jgi:hypothetical protein